MELILVDYIFSSIVKILFDANIIFPISVHISCINIFIVAPVYNVKFQLTWDTGF